MSNIAYIFIDIFILILSLIGILISVGILILIFYHRRQHRINTTVLLICNVYLSLIFSCITLFDMYAYNLYGDLYENVSFVNWWCYIRAYFLYVSIALIYYSYLSQALFRLFRVVFYTYRRLQNFQFMFRLILIQWIGVFLLIIPILLLHQFEYVLQDHHCQILLTNLSGTVITSLIMYQGPINIITAIYYYIMYYIKHTTTLSVQPNRHQKNQRNLIVLRRIVIITGVLYLLLVPTLALWFNHIITGYLYPITYHMEWLGISLALAILPWASIFVTPHIRQMFIVTWRQNRRIQPVIIISPPSTN